jgi:hypothetical protein
MRHFDNPAHLGPGNETFLVRALLYVLKPNFEKQQVKTLMEDKNHNLTRQQKELVLWHNRLAHAGQGWIQDLMHKVKHQVAEAEQPVIPV